ncbi:Transcriptional regulator, AraC family [Actinacidiphila cocklensis]|uniref:Transcriptional regulator, AraC family n=1 Tax=Actinacidiphila cocklensis TaxID=887465 RepID=A0A9W4E851_9ACTN|nr:Transcriptional regulator, AraC family [Actinacidiphila cocklensis]
MPDASEKNPRALMSLSNSALSAGDRFAWYSDLVRENIAPFSLASAYAGDFGAHVLAADLGVAHVAAFSFAPLSATRTPRHIRSGDPETYQLALIQGSPMRVSQRRSDAAVETGSLVFIDTSHPLDADFPDMGRSNRVTMLRLPKSSFPLPAECADRMLSRRLSAHAVTGRLLCHYLNTVLDETAELSWAESYRLGTIAVDLAAAFLSGHLDAQHLLPAETRRRVLLTRIGAFIDRNLGDPELTPVGIAEHHHISVRSLHQLFRAEPETVAATIRRRRLERCRADLADPRLSGQPIGALAARWGFLAPAEFSRAFRASYGMSPRQFRYESGRFGRLAPGDK